MNRIFVYGTLRRGGAWHWLLQLARATYLGTGQIQADLYVDNSYLPYAVKGNMFNIIGELYDVEKEVLNLIDSLEVEYTKRQTTIQTNSRKTVVAYVYFWTKPIPRKARIIPHGDYIRWIQEH